MYDFKNKIALVTGASRGIGYEIAIELAKKGAHVIALARTVGGLGELDDAIRTVQADNNLEVTGATLVPFDLRKKDEELLSIGPMLAQKFGHIDLFIANAGILGPMSPLTHIKPIEFDQVMRVNFTANNRMMLSLDPLLNASKAGRAIFVTSRITNADRAYWGPYAISKIALEKMAGTYALEITNDDLKINIFDPGVAATAMRSKAYPGEDPSTLPSAHDVAQKLVTLIEKDDFVNGEKLVA